MKIIEAHFSDVSTARAVGIRSATAPLVYIAETHSYAQPHLAEIVIPRSHQLLGCGHSGDWQRQPKGRTQLGCLSIRLRTMGRRPAGRRDSGAASP